MNFLVEYLIGVTRAIHPLRWTEVVNHLRRSEGWVPPMMIIAAFGVLVGINAGFGLFGNNGFVRIANYVAISTWYLVSTIATMAVSYDGIRNIIRFPTGYNRPRLWFEISRLAFNFICLLLVTVFAIAITNLKPPAIIDKLLLNSALLNASVFMIASTIGYAASLATGRKRSGKAFQCVQFFYGMTLAGLIVAVFAFALPIWIPILNNPLVLATAIASVALLGIGGIKLYQQLSTSAEIAK